MKNRSKNKETSLGMLRFGELVRHSLSDILAKNEVQDNALTGVTITIPEVRMTADLKLAKAYVIPLGGQHSIEVVDALNRHQKYIRGLLAQMIDAKYAPEIRFHVDSTFEEAARIDRLLHSNK